MEGEEPGGGRLCNQSWETGASDFIGHSPGWLSRALISKCGISRCLCLPSENMIPLHS